MTDGKNYEMREKKESQRLFKEKTLLRISRIS